MLKNSTDTSTLGKTDGDLFHAVGLFLGEGSFGAMAPAS